VDDLRELRVFYEQQGYSEIRSALQDDFLQDPVLFVEHFGRRPEDLTGNDLREFYPHFLVQQRPIRSTHEGFKKRFISGDLFGKIVAVQKMPEMAVHGDLCTA